jgi:hypothetical protein
MQVKKFQGFWTRSDVQDNPRALFVFGDNDIQKGTKGQAIIRGLPNVIGIPTKKIPSLKPGSFYVDDEYDQNCAKIMIQWNKMVAKAAQYEVIYFPENGLGTGLAQMNIHCPKTLTFIERLAETFE